MFSKTSLLACVISLSGFVCVENSNSNAHEPLAKRPIVFNRDIRPLLVDRCYACHGPDAETVAGGLRVDLRDEAIDAGAIVPNDPEESELIRRIFSDDTEKIMPPPDSHKELKPAEQALLKQWISEGAEYQEHWAYAKLAQPTPPDLKLLNPADSVNPAEPALTSIDPKWAINPIDRFVAANLALEGVTSSPRADRVTLIRRLSFDLTGLPPTLAEVDQFTSDNSADAYHKLVERLLASPRFGERMAIYWLDLVRYADTVGYHGDQDVSQSPYRDYVIHAFNNNMTYDRFIREQLAGDLLPEPTLDQLIASGYNRLNQTTGEGGAQAKEYFAIYFADRVRNVSQVFMGATIGCAQCHDHKFDPYTAKDFYAIGAFFADLEEVGVYNGPRSPTVAVPNHQQREQIAKLDQQILEMQSKIETQRAALIAKQADWERELIAKLSSADSQNEEAEHVWIDDAQNTGGVSDGIWNFVSADAGPVHRGEKSRRQQSSALVQHLFTGAKQKIRVEDGTQFFTWVYLDPKTPPTAIMLQFNDGDWEQRAVWGSDEIEYGRKPKSWAGYQRMGALPEAGKWVRLTVPASKVGLPVGSEVNGMAFTQMGGLAHWDAVGWISKPVFPIEISAILAITPEQRSAAQKSQLQEFYLASAPSIIELEQQQAKLKSQRDEVNKSAISTVISKSVKPRPIRLLHRGNWMDDSGKIVEPAIPEFLGKLETGDRRASRLDFANWLCEPDNVLTSRTMVNRLWYLMFGRGICASVDDFGGQGTYPANPELLDWLAVDFVKSGWDMKHTLRTIVNSATYQQTSKPNTDLRLKDPYNEWFARQGRFRVDAEVVRDSALSVSGLLVEKMGGASAKPYQPPKYYAQLNFPSREYQPDQNENQYRRGVYTHWQRTYLHPMLKAFDAPSREEGTCARSRSNTPLQSLTLLNDPTFVEAARVFAARIMNEGGSTTEQRIDWAYRTAISRAADPAIASELKQLFEEHRQQFESDVASANELIKTGNAPVAEDSPPAELAAWTSVARVILNLHEFFTRY